MDGMDIDALHGHSGGPPGSIHRHHSLHAQPWLPPSQIIPVMLLAMLLMVRAIISVLPSRKSTSPQAMPVPAAMAQPQKADSLPEYSLMYIQMR